MQSWDAADVVSAAVEAAAVVAAFVATAAVVTAAVVAAVVVATAAVIVTRTSSLAHATAENKSIVISQSELRMQLPRAHCSCCHCVSHAFGGQLQHRPRNELHRKFSCQTPDPSCNKESVPPTLVQKKEMWAQQGRPQVRSVSVTHCGTGRSRHRPALLKGM